MTRQICPGCGAPYNGKHCRSCYYEPFTEEIAHGNHTHKGEPLVIDAPERKPIPRKNPFGCEKKTRKKRPLAGLAVLLVMINSLLPMIREWGLELEAREEAAHTALMQPEPVLRPENMVVFHQEQGITIFTSVEDFSHFEDSFCLYVQNDSDMNVTASAGEILVNGVSIPHASMVCPAGAGEIGKGWLELDPKELEAAGIREIQTLAFDLTVLRQDGRIQFSTGEILLIAEGANNL